MTDETHCPLCASGQTTFYHRDKRRPYFSCGCCQLVFVPAQWRIDRETERAEYELHENTIEDDAYRAFLSRLSEPLLQRLPVAASGLDFGCGQGPALAAMLREAGHKVALYDSFFVPQREVLAQHYDFICATEVVEHLHRPGSELEQLWQMLRPGGWLAVMTKLVSDKAAFAHWHYKNDPTHVCFFSRPTWTWWAQQRGVEPQFYGADVILLQRPWQFVE